MRGAGRRGLSLEVGGGDRRAEVDQALLALSKETIVTEDDLAAEDDEDE